MDSKNEKTTSVYVRVTPEEKQKIVSNAAKCGLSVSEFLRQRGAGFAPKVIPNEAAEGFYDTLCELADTCYEQVDFLTQQKLMRALNDYESDYLNPSKEVEDEWLLQDSGL